MNAGVMSASRTGAPVVMTRISGWRAVSALFRKPRDFPQQLRFGRIDVGLADPPRNVPRHRQCRGAVIREGWYRQPHKGSECGLIVELSAENGGCLGSNEARFCESLPSGAPACS